jgi:hypothetical protein
MEPTEDISTIKALENLNSVMVTGETIEAWAIQRRIFALTHRRILIAATSGRFIKIQRGLIGGFELVDFRWQDLSDTNIRVGIFGADIILKTFDSTDLAISKNSASMIELSGFRKEQIQQIYRLAQSHVQSWREKRRIRELEELRAKSGGLNLDRAQHLDNNSGNAAAKLQQAKQMLDNKLITDSEFESIKARIISGF